MSRRQRRPTLSLLVVLAMLSGCAGDAEPTVTVAPVSVTTPTSAPLPAPLGERVRAVLAGHAGVQPQEVQIVEVEAIQWPDASLGCPAPGTSYATVITPGYRILVEVAGTRMVVHTDDTGSQLLVCAAGRPTILGDALQDRPLEQRVIAALASTLGMAPADLTVVSQQPVDWPNAGLGCPEEGAMYSQVIVPGHRVIIEANATQYLVHTDRDGTRMVLCQAGMPTMLTGA